MNDDPMMAEDERDADLERYLWWLELDADPEPDYGYDEPDTRDEHAWDL